MPACGPHQGSYGAGAGAVLVTPFLCEPVLCDGDFMVDSSYAEFRDLALVAMGRCRMQVCVGVSPNSKGVLCCLRTSAGAADKIGRR